MEKTTLLITFAQQLMERNHIPVHMVHPPCNDPSLLDHGLRKNILNMDHVTDAVNRMFDRIQPRNVYFITDNFECNYVFLRFPDLDERMICGPVLTEQIDASRLTEIMEKLHIPEQLHEQLQDYYHSLAFFPLQSFWFSLFTLLAENIFGEHGYEVVYADFDELGEWYKKYNGCFRIPEKPFLSIQLVENRYQLEAGIINAVINGNEKKALEMHSQLISSLIPPRLTNSLRDHKDYCITLNTLLRKAAEATGVHPIRIDTFSNRNIQNIERLTSVEQCHNLRMKMILSYCQLVRANALKNYSLLTQKVIVCIDTDLSADLSLKSLSGILSVNASHLSSLFKKEVGVSLTAYVNNKRIRHAQKLLLITDIPIKDIAQQCGFSDIHYFSRLFKQIAGMTPKVYRETATYNNFHSLSNDNWNNHRRCSD